MVERIQKILSAQGICSRRKAEEYIKAGFVKVNGAVAILGQKADPESDRVEVDGKVLEARKEMLYFVMNKPVGVVTANVLVERQQRQQGDQRYQGDCVRTVRELLPKNLRGKIYPVGRLDKETSGLLLFTNDGALAYRLTHPKFDHEKEYEVVTGKPITNGQIRKLENGLKIFGEKTKPARVVRLGVRKFRLALTEGKNRQVRRMCQKVGCPVENLRRVRIVTLGDAKLRLGEVRELSKREKEELLSVVGL